MIKLSISNIGWEAAQDETVYALMQQHGFTGLEIAPTRIFPEMPYDKLSQAREWSQQLKEQYGFAVPSMQSIWYGRTEKIFGSAAERDSLLDYTKKAIDFAQAVHCHNLVFGCPRNRNVPEGMSALEAEKIAIPFFKELGDYAQAHDTVLAMEANPPIYNTNYINDTAAAVELVRHVDSGGFKLNLDVGTMIQNNETADMLRAGMNSINHVHISEPYLAPIQERALHRELMALLTECGYDGYVSIEMGKQQDVTVLEKVMEYVREIR